MTKADVAVNLIYTKSTNNSTLIIVYILSIFYISIFISKTLIYGRTFTNQINNDVIIKRTNDDSLGSFAIHS